MTNTLHKLSIPTSEVGNGTKVCVEKDGDWNAIRFDTKVDGLYLTTEGVKQLISALIDTISYEQNRTSEMSEVCEH